MAAFYLDADEDHFETWTRYALPVAGIACSPTTRAARWVDISEHLKANPEVVVQGPYSIEAPSAQVFSVADFHLFRDHFRSKSSAATRVNITPNLLIRPREPADAKPTRALLSTIAWDYPAFDDWLLKKFADPTASKKVVAVGGVIAAFSMWQRKDERNVKLQTFIVGPSYRGTAIGQHLLYHELRTWADDTQIERVHVTVASSKAELIAYFRVFGFRVEGFSPNRYPRPAAELIMAKHFLREIIRTPSDLERVSQLLSSRLWGLSAGSDTRFGVESGDFAVPALLPAAIMTVNSRTVTVTPRILVRDSSGRGLIRHDDESLMREFYPLRVHLVGKRYASG